MCKEKVVRWVLRRRCQGAHVNYLGRQMDRKSGSLTNADHVRAKRHSLALAVLGYASGAEASAAPLPRSVGSAHASLQNSDPPPRESGDCRPLVRTAS